MPLGNMSRACCAMASERGVFSRYAATILELVGLLSGMEVLAGWALHVSPVIGLGASGVKRSARDSGIVEYRTEPHPRLACRTRHGVPCRPDRKSVLWGKSVVVHVNLGGG